MQPLGRGTGGARLDFALLTTIGLMVLVGLMVLASASGPMGFQKFNDAYWFVKRQILTGVLPGIVGGGLLYVLGPEFFRKNWKFLLIASVVLLVLPFIPGLGNTWGTAQSWIYIAGRSFQTSELVKLTGLLGLAGWLDAYTEIATRDVKRGFLPFTIGLAVILGLLALQPDVGGLAMYAFVALGVYFSAGARLHFVAGLCAAGAAALWLLIKMTPYRAGRFMVFLHPELDPKGMGYHINQALMTIGSGGLMGLGFGHSRQKYQYLPEVEGDSVFAVMAEELGFVFVMLFIGMYMFFVYRLFRHAERREGFARYVLIGVALWIAGQAFVNIASMIGLMPMTGLTLPFVSYGGSSFLTLLCTMGLVLRITRTEDKKSF